MGNQRKREMQVGVMVVIAIIILVGGLMFFKRVSLNTHMSNYKVDLAAVEGLRSGDRVHVRGIRAGQVADFEFLEGVVRVTMELEDWVRLYPNANVTLVMKGLVGEVLIEIEPGGGAALAQPGHIFKGRNAASMLAFGDKATQALDEMSALSEEVRLFVSQLRAEGTLTGPLATAERTLLETEGMMKENREDLRQITTNLAALTTTLEAALGEGKLDSTLQATRRAAASFDSTMVELRAASAQARALMARMDQGEGTVGRLLTDDTLYDRADSTLQSLDRLLDQMRRNPKSMFKASLF
jgi:phospholipid/cholesterol/gamma-HCH transport system substrate-binding protein